MSPAGQIDHAALAGHLDALAQAALQVAEDLRSGVADRGQGRAHGQRTVGSRSNGQAPGNTLLTMTELADLMGIHVRTVRRWRHEGRVPPPLKLKGALRWRRADVDLWLETRRPSRLAARRDTANATTRKYAARSIVARAVDTLKT